MSKFIKKQVKLYRSLNPCYCEAIQETVYFTSKGLNHTLYYRRRPRNHDEKHYRACLLSYVVDVITNSKQATKEIKSSDPKLVITWSLQHEVKVKGTKQVVKVILEKIGNGNTVFLSIMSKRKNRHTKKT